MIKKRLASVIHWCDICGGKIYAGEYYLHVRDTAMHKLEDDRYIQRNFDAYVCADSDKCTDNLIL